MTPKIISRGAEALLLQTSPHTLLKNRIKKSYRFPVLDEKLRRSRTKREAKLLEKASKLIPTPKIISSDDKEKIEMEFIQGKKLSEHLDSLKNALKICETLGKQIAKLHDADIIHGDLTTSNIILSNITAASKTADYSKKRQSSQNWLSNSTKQKLYFIDYGLGFSSSKTEDKAVDLHLIKQALEAKHFKHFKKFFTQVLKGYNSSKNAEQVLSRLQKVELRGRYKQQY